MSGKKEINKTSLLCNVYPKQLYVVWVKETVNIRQLFPSDCGSRCSRREDKDGSRLGINDQTWITVKQLLLMGTSNLCHCVRSPLPFLKPVLQDPVLLHL